MSKLLVRPGTLDNLKESRGLGTDEAMARIVGVSTETYGRVKRGEQSPSPMFIANLASGFQVEPFLFFHVVPTTTQEDAA